MDQTNIGVPDVEGYVPNTTMSETRAPTDGMRVLSDKTPAPQCFVVVVCKKEDCGGVNMIDAYAGPVRCYGTVEKPHPATFMVPVRLA